MKRLLLAGLALFAAAGIAFGQVPIYNKGPRAPTADAPLGFARVLGRSAIPFIGLSSGSVAANGDISAITALPVAYPNAYCWFPANILATVKAAGWYYCTFSTTTAGTAFLDTYTSGTPAIPASPTAVTDGKGVFVGDTGEEFGPTITIPANAIGANGQVVVWTKFSVNNTANVKTGRVRYSASGGTVLEALTLTSLLTGSTRTAIANRGVTNVQLTEVGTGATWNGLGTVATTLVWTAVDTTAATSIVISGQRATATDNFVIESYLIELFSDGS